MKRKSKPRGRPGPASKPPATVRRAHYWFAFALPAVVALAVFANTLANGFVYDDLWKIRRIAEPGTSWWGPLLQGRGLTHGVHLLDQALWDDWAPGFHLTNVFLHALASALVAGAGLSLTRSRRVAFFCGLIFAVHPVHVEAVASFANRKDVLAMIFVALALIVWRGAGRAAGRYALALICFGLALLSKEVAAVGLAGMLFLADLLALPGNAGQGAARLRRASWRSLPFFLGGLAFTHHFAGNLARAFNPEIMYRTMEMQLESYDQVLANAAAGAPVNFRLLFFPWQLCADYAPAPDLRLSSPAAIFGMALAGLWLVATVLLARRAPPYGFALAWTAVTWLPSSNLIPLTHFFVAERYLYVPSFGVCLLLALALDAWLSLAEERGNDRFTTAVIALTVVLITAGGARCALRNRDWQNAQSLWESALRAGCETPRVHHNLGDALARQGRSQEAIPHLVKALRSGPLSIDSRRKLILLLMASGATEEVEKECRSILGQLPEEWGCHAYLGRIAVGKGDYAPAVAHYREVLKAQPGHTEVLKQLAWLLATHPEAQLCALPEALALAERAREATGGEDPEVLYHLALLHAQAEDFATAAQWARRAFSLALAQHQPNLARLIQPTLRRLAYLEHRQRRYR